MPPAPAVQFARDQARQRLHAVRHQIHSAAHRPEDPEAIHDLRVSIRRFTQGVRAFRTLFDPKPIKKLRRRLHKLMDLCGNVRTCDVALDVFKTAGVTDPALLSRIRAARAEAESSLRDNLRKQHLHRHSVWALKLPVRNARAADWNVDSTMAANLSAVLPGLVDEFFAAGKVAATATGDPAALHLFRLKTKHFRYTLELFASFYGEEFQAGLKSLKRVQDRLGDVNDCVSILPLLAGDAAAQAAVQKLLAKRVKEFAAHWKRTFPEKKLEGWRKWLGNPAPPAVKDIALLNQ